MPTVASLTAVSCSLAFSSRIRRAAGRLLAGLFFLAGSLVAFLAITGTKYSTFFGRNHDVVTVLCARRAMEPRLGRPGPAQDDVSPAPEADGDASGGAGPEDPDQ